MWRTKTTYGNGPFLSVGAILALLSEIWLTFVWKQIKDRMPAAVFRCLRHFLYTQKSTLKHTLRCEAEGHTQEEAELCEMHTSSLPFSPPVLMPLTAQPINRGEGCEDCCVDKAFSFPCELCGSQITGVPCFLTLAYEAVPRFLARLHRLPWFEVRAAVITVKVTQHLHTQWCSTCM